MESLFRNTLIPDFQRAYPRYRVDYTNLLHGLGARQLLERLVAGVRAGRQRIDLDLLEDTPVNYPYPAGKSYRDYFVPLTAREVPNSARVEPSLQAGGAGYAVAYRASAVVLAYDSAHVPRPPGTFAALIDWIRAHPGRFSYCPPDLGGSGGSFVASALRSVMDERLLHRPYRKESEHDWPKAWALLHGIEPDLLQGGFHPMGNLPVLNLLGKGVLWMAPVWSDQAVLAQEQGLLPRSIRYAQISPAFAGGPAWLSVPRLAQNPAGARAFVDFVLRPEEQARLASASRGFPAIANRYLAPGVASRLGPLAGNYGFWPGGAWDVDLLAGWRTNVPSA